jgi:hypothetical protein
MMPRIRSMPTNKLHVRYVESDEKMKLENFCILSFFPFLCTCMEISLQACKVVHASLFFALPSVNPVKK